MDSQSLANVLEILRRLKEEKSSVTTLQIIIKWSKSPGQIDPGTVLRMAAHIQEQVRAAQTVIGTSSLPEEAKAGVRLTLNALASSFSLSGLNNPVKTGLANLEGPISNFVLLLGMAGVNDRNEVPPEAEELAKEVEEMIKQFDDEAIDPVIRDIAKRHLATLSTLLRNIPIFGLEAALATYFEMIILLRRAATNTSKESKAATKPLMERIEGWRKSLEAIDEVWNIGARWIGAAKGVGALLLSYIPGASG